VLTSIGVAIAAAIGASSVFDRVDPFGFQDPSSESAKATDALEEATGERPTPDVVIAISLPGGDRVAPSRAAAAPVAQELREIKGVTRVQTPRDDVQLVSPDGRVELVVGYLDADIGDISKVGEAIEKSFADEREVTAGGNAVTAYELNRTTEEDLRRIELIAAPLLFLLSLVVFRGLVAATLPLVVGALSIILTLLALRLLTDLMEIDLFVINIVTGLGLGLAIDYSLFVVSRFRDCLRRGASTGEALRETMGSTGRMIMFSGLTVAIALASLCVFPQRFLYSIGVGGAVVAIASALVCLTVLPALLAILGPKVNAVAPRQLQGHPSGNRWYGLGRAVLRHPGVIAFVLVGAMIAAGIPFLRVELTRADASVLPTDSSAHRLSKILEGHFPSDPSSLVTVAIEGEPGTARAIGRAKRELATTDGVARVTGPTRVSGGLRRVDAQLDVDPFSDTALDAVGVARDLHWGAPTLVNGPPAELVDQRHSLGKHLPLAIAIIVISTFLLLLLLTRSVVLPILALVMNALTVSVAFGLLVLVFQDGRFQDALDYTSQGALDTSMPILLFAVAFGLSTDYGVFLLQRIAECRAPARSEEESIALGLARSGRPITAAALLFAVAMGAFVFSDLVFIKEVAVGTAAAVLVDATLVRALLFPALLGLLGSRAWWAPSWVARREEPGLR
jgi:uncharacterized membrane protein YdfJ with MMPL/SSD domain